MDDNRRAFLKKVSIAGAAALAAPGILTAGAKENKQSPGGDIPKPGFSMGIRLPMAVAVIIWTGTMFTGKIMLI